MTTYARVREEEGGRWQAITLRNLEGQQLDWTPSNIWVKVVCFDSMESGLYVLTEDDDFYFTAHSICLTFTENEELVKKTIDPVNMILQLLRWNLGKINQDSKRMRELIGELDQYLVSEDMLREIESFAFSRKRDSGAVLELLQSMRLEMNK